MTAKITAPDERPQQTPELELQDRKALQLAVAALKEGDAATAVHLFRRAIKADPNAVGSYIGLALALERTKDIVGALWAYDRALSRDPTNSNALNMRGNLLLGERRFAEALQSYDLALANDPNNAGFLSNQGAALLGLRRLDEALHACARAIELDPTLAEAQNNRGNALRELRRFDEAMAAFELAVAIKPALAEAWINLGNTALKTGHLRRAVEALEKGVSLNPDRPFARGHLLHAKCVCCDWNGLGELRDVIDEDVSRGLPVAEPFGYQAVATVPALLKIVAENFTASHYPPRQPLSHQPPLAKADGKIRLGYLCGEFRNQATSILMAEVYELHDRGRFEVFAFDNGWDDGSAIRQRMNMAFSEIVDISSLDDLAAARSIAERRIDILINLNGFFGDNRQGVFAHRAAPIQVNYLGFPGTIGAPYIDYIVADATVITPADYAHYTEKVVILPGCYQANDRRRSISSRLFQRADLGLPADAIVFCCFNASYKILPDAFDVWASILARVPKSVLWLLQDHQVSSDNLRREAEARGIASSRLIFAERISHADHLARHAAADLFLDSWPYNAHTTASDALWAGLPVLTCQRATFPGRVAASLLRAVDMPELITSTPADFAARAVRLAESREELRQLRQKLGRNISTANLFNTPRLTRSLEAAYQEMHAKRIANQFPSHFHVPPN